MMICTFYSSSDDESAKRAMPMRVERWIIHGHPPWHCKKAEKNEWLDAFGQVGTGGGHNPQHVGIFNSV
jgi:hypothetical protein